MRPEPGTTKNKWNGNQPRNETNHAPTPQGRCRTRPALLRRAPTGPPLRQSEADPMGVSALASVARPTGTEHGLVMVNTTRSRVLLCFAQLTGHHFRKVKPTPWGSQHPASVAAHIWVPHGMIVSGHHAQTPRGGVRHVLSCYAPTSKVGEHQQATTSQSEGDPILRGIQPQCSGVARPPCGASMECHPKAHRMCEKTHEREKISTILKQQHEKNSRSLTAPRGVFQTEYDFKKKPRKQGATPKKPEDKAYKKPQRGDFVSPKPWNVLK